MRSRTGDPTNAEESLFRGYLHRELTPRLGFPAGYQGLVYGALRGRDRSLVTAATTHALCWGVVGLY